MLASGLVMNMQSAFSHALASNAVFSRGASRAQAKGLALEVEPLQEALFGPNVAAPCDQSGGY